MTPEAITAAALIANSTLTGIMGEDVFIERVPQGFTTYPCILINVISETPDKGQTGDCVDTVKLMVSVIAEKYSTVSEVGILMRSTLDGIKGTFGTTVLIGCIYESGSVEPDFDDGKFFTKSIDFKFLIQK
jgi:hypothetical protein